LVYFSPYFYSLRRNGGQTGGEIWVYIEFIAARLPTLQIWGEKKVIPYLKFNTPGTTPSGLNVKLRSERSEIIAPGGNLGLPKNEKSFSGKSFCAQKLLPESLFPRRVYNGFCLGGRTRKGKIL